MGPQFCGAIDNDRSIGNEMALNGAELVTNGRGGKRCLKGVFLVSSLMMVGRINSRHTEGVAMSKQVCRWITMLGQASAIVKAADLY